MSIVCEAMAVNSAELSHNELLKSAKIEVGRGADDGILFKYRF